MISTWRKDNFPKHVSDFQFTSIYIKVIWELMCDLKDTRKIENKNQRKHHCKRVSCFNVWRHFLEMFYYDIFLILIEHVIVDIKLSTILGFSYVTKAKDFSMNVLMFI